MQPLHDVCARLDAGRVWHHLEQLSRLDKLSGGPGADEACAYIADALRLHGIPFKVHHFEAYLSNPLESSLTLEDGTSIPSRPRSFSKNCPLGVEGLLAFDPNNRNQLISDAQWDELLESFRGKLVISHGFDERYAKRLEQHGALGWIQVWSSDDPLIHEDTVSGVWGAPTQDSAFLLPALPVIGISMADGLMLEQRLLSGPLKARLISRVETGVFPLCMPEADIPSQSDDFVLVSCHYDSWYLGAVDNCAANAAALEMARVLWDKRDELLRGVRILWWAGHSNGRYAGSSWYFDQHWTDLHAHCIAHINCDLAGAQGTDRIAIHTTGAEGRSFGRRLAAIAAPDCQVEFHTIARGADQSFWGAEIPFHLYSRSVCEPGKKRSATPGPGAPEWHTKEDTIDKISPEALFRDARLFYLMAYAFAAQESLPYSGEEFFSAMETELERVAADCEPCFDFSPVIKMLQHLKRTAQGAIGRGSPISNQAIRRVCGVMNRLRQSSGSPFDLDPAFSTSQIFPRLGSVRGKRREDMSPESFLFLSTDFVRQKNRMLHEISLLEKELAAITPNPKGEDEHHG